MSRNDLSRIQQQLKEAIQAHHVMLSKLKADPNNAELKADVKKKQAEIASLCDKQKQSVQKVHQEFVAKKPPTQSTSERLTQPALPSTTAKVADANGAVQASGKKSSAVLKVPQFYPNVSTAAPATAAQPVRPLPVANQGKEAAASTVLLPAAGAASSTAAAAGVLPPGGATSAGAVGSSGSAPSVTAGVSGPPSAAAAAVPPTNFANGSSSVASVLDGSSLLSAYSRLSDAHFLAIAQKTMKRATSPTMRRKLEFLAAVDLIPTEAALELQRKRTERKRRTTANPQFSYQDSQAFEAKKHVYLSNASGVKRPRGRPPSRPPLVESRQTTAASTAASSAVSVVADDAHDDFCAVCRRSGQLLLCDTCNLVYHLECLSPPLSAVPDGNWSCPKCIALRKPSVVAAVPPGSGSGIAPPASSSRACSGSSVSGKPALSSTVVTTLQTFIEQKAALEEEKLVLLKHNAELASEKQRLENRVDHLSETVVQQVQRKSQIRATQAESLRSVQQITDLVRVLHS